MPEEKQNNISEEVKQEVVKKTDDKSESGTSDKAVAVSDGKPEKKIKGKKRADVQGVAHIRASFNNTNVTVTNMNGNVVCWSTPGKGGFKGSRKSTPYAAGIAAENAAKTALSMGMKRVEVRVRGAGSGRESAIRSIKAAGLDIISIKDVTGIPYNGCRPPKKRRI